ncbi:MAG: GNAT family N-acetyltransferase [Pseudomonadota bacterium]
MRIRPASREDAVAISELLVALSKAHIAMAFGEEGKRNLIGSMTPDSIEGYMEEGFRFHVAVEGPRVVGVVGTRDESHLFHLFVHDDFQGQGLATQLWHVGRDACIDSGKNPGHFTVNSSLNAQQVYRHFGFEPLGGIREGGGVRDVPMRLELHS